MLRDPLQARVGKYNIKAAAQCVQALRCLAHTKFKFRMCGTGRSHHVFGAVHAQYTRAGVTRGHCGRAVAGPAANVQNAARIPQRDARGKVVRGLCALRFEFEVKLGIPVCHRKIPSFPDERHVTRLHRRSDEVSRLRPVPGDRLVLSSQKPTRGVSARKAS